MLNWLFFTRKSRNIKDTLCPLFRHLLFLSHFFVYHPRQLTHFPWKLTSLHSNLAIIYQWLSVHFSLPSSLLSVLFPHVAQPICCWSTQKGGVTSIRCDSKIVGASGSLHTSSFVWDLVASIPFYKFVGAVKRPYSSCFSPNVQLAEIQK